MNSADMERLAEGVAAYKNGHYELAVDHFQSVVERDPSDWNAQFYLAMCLTQLNKNKEARMYFMAIRDLCPQDDLRRRAASAVVALSSKPH